MYWLDAPPISAEQRAALARAFDEATLYDEAARTALDSSFLAVPQALRLARR
jgi:hypothetical protein